MGGKLWKLYILGTMAQIGGIATGTVQWCYI